MNQTMLYDEERGTWNLFVDGEWYYEGTYEECSDMMFNNSLAYNGDSDDYYVPDDYYGEEV